MLTLEALSKISDTDNGLQYTGIPWNYVVTWAAEGIKVVDVQWTDAEGVQHLVHDAWIEAEQAPLRSYTFKDLRKGIVANINGQSYCITVSDSWDNHDMPSHMTVSFEETTDAETPWMPFDIEAAKAQEIKTLETAIRRADNSMDKLFFQRQIDDIESGRYVPRPNSEVSLFGRPCFLQTPIFPMYEGQVARCLMVLETGWGDSGNINLLFTCDAAGRPNKVWMESSCC